MVDSLPRILLFEDDAAFSNTLRVALSPTYQLDISANMLDTRGLMRLHEYDAVISDLTILGDITAESSKGGLRLIEDMRGGAPSLPDWCRTVPIIAISGSSETGLVTAAEVGANAVLAKPFKPERLAELIGEELTRASKRRR